MTNDKNLSAKKVAVLAITNFLSLPECRNVLLGMKLQSILEKFTPPKYNGDPNLIKCVQKAL